MAMQPHPVSNDAAPALRDAAALATAAHVSAIARAVLAVPADDVLDTAGALIVVAALMAGDDPANRAARAR
jgi:hypothetical protein